MAHTPIGGSRMVEPRKAHRSRRKNRASDARRLVRRIDEASAELRASDTLDHESVTARLTAMHRDKRSLRRDVYAEMPSLEGAPVIRNRPSSGA
jgi:hypothetical protein